MRDGLILFAALLLTGFDAPAQDITTEPDLSLEAVGVTCVALAVFAEARDASWLEQALVARAIVNRQAQLPAGADACDVVMAPGYSPRLDAWAYPRRPWLIDARAWDRALEVVQVVIDDGFDLPRACAGVTGFTSAPTGATSPGDGVSPTVCTVGALTFTGQQP